MAMSGPAGPIGVVSSSGGAMARGPITVNGHHGDSYVPGLGFVGIAQVPQAWPAAPVIAPPAPLARFGPPLPPAPRGESSSNGGSDSHHRGESTRDSGGSTSWPGEARGGREGPSMQTGVGSGGDLSLLTQLVLQLATKQQPSLA